MKKIIAVLMVLMLTLSLCACGSSSLKGEEQTWGNISVFVPEGWNLTGGDLLDENDPDKLSLKDPDADSFTYVNVLIDTEENIDNNINATKEMNEGTSDTTVKVGEAEWTGLTYESIGYKCGYLKHVAADKVYAVYFCGYATDDAAFQAILGSLK